MQARYLTILVATTALAAALTVGAAASAAETEHDRHVFVNNASDTAPAAQAGSANGGVWRTTDGAGAAEQTSPDQVQAAPAEAQFDMFIRLGGVEGDSEEPPPPPPPPPPQNAPVAEAGVQAQGGETAALIVPAVQRVRESAARAPVADGVVVLDTALPQSAPAPRDPEMPICGHCASDATDVQPQHQAAQTDGLMFIRALFGLRGSASEAAPTPADTAAAQTQTDGLLIMRATEGDAIVPEIPICGHCSADVAAPPAAAQTPAAPAERPRRRFSLSIGGVTLSSDGGVSVAVGDVTGDGQESRREQTPGRAARAPSAARSPR